ncbi:hypothetical protein [Endozoicomonas sp.]|uniref:hypothetical protein n=1 Tax=Endozoicomonas sp. TaxID=1892382 RepID=UPI002888BB9E|nr:hypothetical protein [Endozoicomonas sp.]
MKKLFLTVGIFLFSASAFSALAPEFQNIRDIEDMLRFLKEGQNIEVAATINSIDLDLNVIHYGESCKVFFVRKESEHPKGWAGPAEPLVKCHIECDPQNP